MSKDKYPSLFFPQVEAIVFIIYTSNIFHPLLVTIDSFRLDLARPTAQPEILDGF